MTKTKRAALLAVLPILLIVLTLLTACDNNTPPADNVNPVESQPEISYQEETSVDLLADGIKVGTGDTRFLLSIFFPGGSGCQYTVSTNQTNLLDALTEAGLCSGSWEDSTFALKSPDQGMLTPDSAEFRWAIYINNEPATAAPAEIQIAEGQIVAILVEPLDMPTE